MESVRIPWNPFKLYLRVYAASFCGFGCISMAHAHIVSAALTFFYQYFIGHSSAEFGLWIWASGACAKYLYGILSLN